MEWAVTEHSDGYVNEYELDTKNLSVLNLGNGDFNVLNWLAILLQNRIFQMSDFSLMGKQYIIENFMPEYANYDVIYGYRADDSYFSYANAFLNNILPIDKLYKVMQLGNLGTQYALKSELAFNKLRFVGYKRADKQIYYPLKTKRDNEARNLYRQDFKDMENGVFLMDIMRERWSNDDKRLQRIVY